MNFGPFPLTVEAPLAPRDWYVHFESEIHLGSMAMTACLTRENRDVCRLSIAGALGPDLAVRSQLVQRARIFVREYLQRQLAGNIGFGDLAS